MTERQARGVIAGWAARVLARQALAAISQSESYTDAQRVQLLEAATQLIGRLRRQAHRDHAGGSRPCI